MVDAPERIWVGTDGPQPDYEVWELEQSGSTEYVRADLYEQVKRERGEANADRDRWYGSSFEATKRAEAAERLAGARVKMPSGELCRYIEQCREISNGGEYPWWSRLAEILSALAEPAGEAGPVAWRYKLFESDPKWTVATEKPKGVVVEPLFTTPPTSELEAEIARLRLAYNTVASAAHIAATHAETRLAEALKALERHEQGWTNVLELDLLPPQHRGTAEELRSHARRVREGGKADG